MALLPKLRTSTARLATAALLALAGPIAAHAVPVVPPSETFFLTSDHCTGGCGPQSTSFGTIVVTDNGSGVLSVVITLLNGNEFVSTGFDAEIGFNLIGNPTITYSGVTSGFTPVANPETAGSLHMDGTGYFEYGLLCTGCGNGGSNPLTGPLDFTITGTGLTLASFEQNADGQFWAVDIISGTTGKTGAVDASNVACTTNCEIPPPTDVPEPGTLALLGLALAGLGFARRRKH